MAETTGLRGYEAPGGSAAHTLSAPASGGLSGDTRCRSQRWETSALNNPKHSLKIMAQGLKSQQPSASYITNDATTHTQAPPPVPWAAPGQD